MRSVIFWDKKYKSQLSVIFIPILSIKIILPNLIPECIDILPCIYWKNFQPISARRGNRVTFVQWTKHHHLRYSNWYTLNNPVHRWCPFHRNQFQNWVHLNPSSLSNYHRRRYLSTNRKWHSPRVSSNRITNRFQWTRNRFFLNNLSIVLFLNNLSTALFLSNPNTNPFLSLVTMQLHNTTANCHPTSSNCCNFKIVWATRFLEKRNRIFEKILKLYMFFVLFRTIFCYSRFVWKIW